MKELTAAEYARIEDIAYDAMSGPYCNSTRLNVPGFVRVLRSIGFTIVRTRDVERVTAQKRERAR